MIQRYTMTGQDDAEIYVDEDDFGKWVSFLDHQQEIEALEYELRYLREQYAESIESREMCRIDLLPPFGPGC